MVPALGAKARFRFLVGQVLHDHRPLGQNLSVVESKRRDVAVRVDLDEVLAAGGALGGVIDLVQIEAVTRLAQDDMRSHRAGARAKYSFMVFLLS